MNSLVLLLYLSIFEENTLILVGDREKFINLASILQKIVMEQPLKTAFNKNSTDYKKTVACS
jgi:hypothetical protein